MPDTAADRKLADAALSAMEERSYGHPAFHLRAIELFFEKLAKSQLVKDHLLQTEEFDKLVCEAAKEAFNKSDAINEISRTVIDAYRLFRREDGQMRLAHGVAGPWLDVATLLAPGISTPQRRIALAHLHTLAYPEIVDAVEQFSLPGKRRGVAVDSLRDRFIFGRKVNSTICGYLITACVNFKMIEESGELIRAKWAPPPVLATIVVRRYLMLTGYRPDTAHDVEDVLNQASFALPRDLFGRHPAVSSWLKALRPPSEIIGRELSGAIMRISLDGLTWFAANGLISPLDCGKILRTRRAKDSLSRVRTAIIRRFENEKLDQPPINSGQIEAELQPE
jgi:hypothetical protein